MGTPPLAVQSRLKMFEDVQMLTNFMGKGFKYTDCSADYKTGWPAAQGGSAAGVDFTPPYCNVMKPDAYLIAYGQKTVPQKIDAKYKRNPRTRASGSITRSHRR